MENCEYRKSIDVILNFTKEHIEIANKAKETLKDISADNTQLITSTYYQRIWLTALTEINSNKRKYQEVIQDGRNHTIEEAILDEEKQYVVCTSDNPIAKQELDKYRYSGEIEIIFENERGYVAKIIR